MARLPVPGSDFETWDEILNEYLSIAHNADGTLKGTAVAAASFAATDATRSLTLADRIYTTALSMADCTGFDNRGNSDQAATFNELMIKARLRAEQYYNTSAAIYGIVVVVPPGLYRFDTSPAPVNAGGMIILAYGARFVYTPTSGTFLNFVQPLAPKIYGLELYNGTVVDGSTTAGKLRRAPAPYDAVGTTATGLKWSNSGGSSGIGHYAMQFQGFDLAVENDATVNGDNLWFDECRWYFNNHDFRQASAQNQIITFKNCRFQETKIVALDILAGFRILCLNPEIILPSIFVRFSENSFSDFGRPHLAIIGGKMEGWVPRDNTKKPKLLQINGNIATTTSFWGVIVDDFSVTDSTFDVASNLIECNDANANIVFRDSFIVGKIFLKPSSQILTGPLLNERAGVIFHRCFKTPAPSDIVLDYTRTTTATGSNYQVRWQECSGRLDYSIGGVRLGNERNPISRIKCAPTYERIRSGVESHVYTLTFPGRVFIKSVHAVVTNGMAGALGGALTGTANTLKVFADAGLTQQLGVTRTPTTIDTVHDMQVSALATTIYLEGSATGASGNIPGYWLVEYESAWVPA